MISLHTYNRIIDTCPGWSSWLHVQFFDTVVCKPEIKRVLILGVYHGRDIAFIKAMRPDMSIVGVDLFQDAPCADWPEEKKALTWQQAGFGEPPRLEVAQRNLVILGHRDVELFQGDAVEWLRKIEPAPWDYVYVDTSHDYATTHATIKAFVGRTREIGGDDYSDQGTWGVKQAVKECFRTHQVYGGWCWTALSKDFKGGLGCPGSPSVTSAGENSTTSS